MKGSISKETLMTFQAIVARQTDGGVSARVETLQPDFLGDGDVAVSVEWSNVNYKDAVALAGLPVIQRFPLIPGIDFSGTVESSADPRFKAGDRVVATGWELSQKHNGGFAQKAKVPADWLVKLPDAISTRDAMAIGTAGFTAMLSVLALEHGGVTPQSGDILVTGASGGVGSIAIALLSKLGFRVVASTGKLVERDYLTSLGADEVIDRNSLSEPGAAVAEERWAGAIDAVGGQTLANILAQTKYGGVVTTCGFVNGRDVPASVLPFILRGITLAGIESVYASPAIRQVAWQRLATDLDAAKLAATVSEVGLDGVADVIRHMLDGNIRGRTLVDVNR
jgi:acrylyl-CoA reductase (NADPH)